MNSNTEFLKSMFYNAKFIKEDLTMFDVFNYIYAKNVSKIEFNDVLTEIFNLVLTEYRNIIRFYISRDLEEKNMLDKEMERKIESFLDHKFSNINLYSDYINTKIESDEYLNELLCSNRILKEHEMQKIINNAEEYYMEEFIENVLGMTCEEFKGL